MPSVSQPPSGSVPGDGAEGTPEVRPRPSWGQPGPSDPHTAPLGGGADQSGDQRQPSYGSDPRAGAPEQYGSVPYGGPAAPPQSWAQQAPDQQGWGQPSAAQYGQDLGRHEQAYAQYYGEKPRTGLSIASMVLGILAFLSCWIPFVSYAAVIMALLAVIFGIVGLRRSGRGMAITGLVLGGIALIASVLFSIFYTTIFIDAARVAQECAEQDPSLGREYERCVNDRTGEIIPFQ